jgi:uncharacterized repeat protein (TIGR01451 family)
MKRKLLAFSMTVALLLSVFSVANVGAHTVTIERGTTVPSRTDWWGVQPDTGQGAIMRNKAQQGEFIFNDATKTDHRLISTTSVVTRAADLDWFGVTADADNIYFLAKVERYNGITQSPAIELMITIDTDHVSSSNPIKTQLPLNDLTVQQTNVPSDAAWEFVVDTSFQPGPGGFTDPPHVAGSTKIWTNSGVSQTSTNCPAATCPSQLAGAAVSQGSFAEIAVPWTSINGAKPTGANFLRFTVATMYSNSPRSIPLDGFNSPVIDVLGIGATLADIQDGTMNTSFDVHFDTNPAPVNATYEPYAPLQITEFQPNPLGTDTPTTGNPNETEWIEIYNPNSFALSLSDYKVGNAAKRGSAEGMFRFKSGETINAKTAIIVAKFRLRFLAGHPGYTGKVYDLTTDLTKYTDWASGNTIGLDNEPLAPATTFEDQVLLLDAKDDVVDLVNYGNSATPTPGNIAIFTSGVAEGVSFERCPAGLDTNGGFDRLTPATNNIDFISRDSVAAQTPGIACIGRSGVDMQLVKTANVTNAAPGDTVVFTLSYSNVGTNNEPAPGTVAIADTLPAGLTFVSASVAPTTQNGQNLSWTVAAPNAGGLPSEINVTTTINNGIGENVPLVNNASITSPSDTDATTQANNAGQATVTTLGPALLNLSFEKLGGNTPPNATFEFKLNYSNTGQDDATDTTITLNIPANVTLISADAPGASANFTTPIVGGPGVSVTWSIPNLASNTAGSIALKAQVANNTALGTTLTFTAQAQGVSGTTPVTAQTTGIRTVALNKLHLPMIVK